MTGYRRYKKNASTGPIGCNTLFKYDMDIDILPLTAQRATVIRIHNKFRLKGRIATNPTTSHQSVSSLSQQIGAN